MGKVGTISTGHKFDTKKLARGLKKARKRLREFAAWKKDKGTIEHDIDKYPTDRD